MKYICLGYIDEKLLKGWSQEQLQQFMDQCFIYDDKLREKGYMIGGEALEGPDSAVTLRKHNDKISVTDGPFAETKEFLGGIMILEAKDLNLAIQLMSKHPNVLLGGTWEIRPAADLSEMMAESKQRRSAK